MRVIGGEFRSRALKSLPGLDVRPTPDRLREALFNVLATRVQGASFLDLYAGTGAVGIEALSRGAAQVTLVEADRGALKVIHENLRALGIDGRVDVRAARVTRAIPALRADIVFLDPPYPLEKEYGSALNLLGQHRQGLVIAQHPPRLILDDDYGRLHRTRVLKQGDNWLSFYETPDRGTS
jgi:16S rRNA (guanine966-N2)-methyltransferase